jgi:S1-C subfamily serine protease
VSVGLALLTGLAGAALALAVVAATGRLDSPATTEAATDTPRATPVSLAAATAVESVIPAVAHLSVTRADGASSASAVIYRQDGYLLTTVQAISKSTAITAVLSNGHSLPATVVGLDPASQVAVLHVAAQGLRPAPLGRSAFLRVGDATLTVGDPTGDGSSVLADGVVRSLRRSVLLPTVDVGDLIATNQPVPADADGGAMVDASGKVAGLSLSVPAVAGDAPTGFAVPIDVVKAIADQLITTGRVEHGWLGISGADLADITAQRLGVDGVKLSAVEAGSPAEDAGLRPGDIIISVGETPVASMAQLASLTSSRRPGTRLPVEYLRGADHAMTTVVLGRPRS